MHPLRPLISLPQPTRRESNERAGQTIIQSNLSFLEFLPRLFAFLGNLIVAMLCVNDNLRLAHRMQNQRVHLFEGIGGKLVAYGGDRGILEDGEFRRGGGVLYEGDGLDAELGRC